MMSPRWRLALFALVCAAQLAVAGSIIARSERVIEAGELLRFRTAPVDPADLVRGRYVALAFRETSGPPRDAAPFAEGDGAFALLEVDAEGFAKVTGVAHARPATGAYLEVVVRNATPELVTFRFPVDRFYMPEEQAPAAERAHREALSGGRGTWAEIRVYQGSAQIERLVVDGVPVSELAAGEAHQSR